jgi:predicted permease
VLTLAVSLARRYGEDDGGRDGLLAGLARVPALWAALLASLLGGLGFPLPEGLEKLAKMLGGAVTPLMLFSLGLSLRLDVLQRRNLIVLAPILLFKLLLMPLIASQLAPLLGFTGETLRAVVLETAMPSMVVGIVLCDRFHLDGSLYALTVTLTTLLSMETLPLWYGWLASG